MLTLPLFAVANALRMSMRLVLPLQGILFGLLHLPRQWRVFCRDCFKRKERRRGETNLSASLEKAHTLQIFIMNHHLQAIRIKE